MKMNPITIRPQYYRNIRIKHQYYILHSKKPIGEISFIKKKEILIIGFLGIYKEYRNNHYGYQVIEYILSHYKIKCIIGQTLYESRTFWNKCIKRFNGQRRNICTLDNCSSSFVIPKWNISNDVLYEMLKIGHQIE